MATASPRTNARRLRLDILLPMTMVVPLPDPSGLRSNLGGILHRYKAPGRRLSSSSTESETKRLVGRWAVGGRHRLAVQAQIDAELRAVMDDVVHEHLAVGEKTRSLEDRLALKRQLPRLGPRRVWHVPERVSNLGGGFVERPNELCPGLVRQRRKAALREVQPGFGKDREPEAAELGDVRRKLSERHGLGMRGEVAFASGDALERRARLLHFVVEFRQEQIVDW